jgi:glycerol uptake facilitator-like aquaporin
MQGDIKSELTTFACETTGSFTIVLLGAGVICAGLSISHLPGLIGAGLVCGLGVGGAMAAIGRVSDPYLNPAIALAALLAKRISGMAALRLITAELFGGVLAGVLLRFLFPAAVGGVRLGAPAVASGVSFGRAILLEGGIAAAWTLVSAITTWRGAWPTIGAVATGAVCGGCVLFVGPLTGATGNPARAFGPAFAAGSYVDQLVYWIGPLCGAAVVGLLVRAYRTRFGDQEQAVAPDSEWALACYREGITLYSQGLLEEAAQEFAWASELNPDWPEPYYYLGLVCQEVGEKEGAKAFFDVAMRFRGRQCSTSPPARTEQ